MSQQNIENKECNEFLEKNKYKINLEPMSKDWEIETIRENTHITLIIKSSKRFIQNEIEFIVDTIHDKELVKFDILRELGWCSSSKIIESSPRYLEFSWLNLRERSEDSTIEKCSYQICLYRFDN